MIAAISSALSSFFGLLAPAPDPLLNSTSFGVIIGALIGIIPTIAVSIIELVKMHRQFKHDLLLHELDMVESPRLNAIREYSRYLGAFLSDSSLNVDFSESGFFAAHANAAVFVSGNTLRAMIAAQPVILSGWYGSSSDMTAKEKLDSPEISVLLNCLNSEMYSSVKYLKIPAGRRD